MKNCCLIIGNFKNPHDKDTFIQNVNSYINILIDLNKKIVKPNNCDVFICTGFNVEYEIFDIVNQTLNKNNYKKVVENVKNIFSDKLKQFVITDLNDEYVKEEREMLNEIDIKYNYIKNENKFGYDYKFHKIIQLVTNYEKLHNFEYDNFIITRPDITFSKEMLITDYNMTATNTIYCWYFIICVLNKETLKYIGQHFINEQNYSLIGEDRYYKLYKNLGLTHHTIGYPLVHYHRQRYMETGWLNKYNAKDVAFLSGK